MANSYHHAVSSAKKWGGEAEDYLPIHDWFDSTKAHIASPAHRALRHHSEGIFLMESIFGPTITISTGSKIPTRWVGEQHMIEDFGHIPSVQDWMDNLNIAPWMNGKGTRKISRELELV